jgi:hypothetical protein
VVVNVRVRLGGLHIGLEGLEGSGLA